MEKFFRLREHGTDVRTELLAGFTTFLTMSYIIFVNPQILRLTGMDAGGVFTATILAAAIGTFFMGFVANVPFAQAPGMGLNAFFTFTVVFALGFTWQQALAMVFLCGLINITITITKIRKMILMAIPKSLQYAISGGIGLFIAYVGIKQAGFLQFTAESSSLVTDSGDGGGVFRDIIPSLTDFTNPAAQVALIGLTLTVLLMALKINGAILIGILATAALGLPFGITKPIALSEINFQIPSLAPVSFQLDFHGLFADPQRLFVVLITILAFSITDTFDTIGTFLGTGRKTGIFDAEDEAKIRTSDGFHSKLEKALFADATATSIGALLGTSNTTSYVESATGISQGGRTGLTSVTTGVLFLLALFLAPIALAVPAAATAPALIVVGILMADGLRHIEWEDLAIAIPSFFILTLMAFTFSITNGIAAGFIFYCLLMLVRRRGKEVHPILFIVAGLFILSFVLSAFA